MMAPAARRMGGKSFNGQKPTLAYCKTRQLPGSATTPRSARTSPHSEAGIRNEAMRTKFIPADLELATSFQK
jgi:hypothetical protein